MRSLIDFPSRPLWLALTLSATLGLAACSGSEERQASYLTRAQEFYEEGNLEKARIEVKNVLQINANNAEARFLLASLEERERNWQQMFGNLNAAVEADPKMTKAHIKLAQLMIASNQLDNALAQVDKVQAYDSDNADALAIRAAVLSRQDRDDEAIELAQKALQLDPGHVNATGVLANIFMERDIVEAERLLAEGLKRNPKNTILQMLQIKAYTQQNKTDEVIATYRRLSEENPDVLLYPIQLASFYVTNNRLDDAEALLRELIKKNPEKNEVKLMLADFLAQYRSPDKTRGALAEFVKTEPDNYTLRGALARFYLGSKEVDNALATYQYTIDKEPTSADAIDARNRVSELMMSQDKRPQAEALLKEIFKLEPENPDALLMRARLALVDGDANAAIGDLRTVLKQNPDSAAALALLGSAQERTGAIDLALDSYQRLLALEPQNSIAILGSARLLMARDKLDEARKVLEPAWQKANGSPELASLLADIYSRQQQPDKALEVASTLLINQRTAPLGYYLIGTIETRRKNLDKAITALETSLEKEPRAIEPLRLLVNVLVIDGKADRATRYLQQQVKAHPELPHAQELLAALYRQTGKTKEAEQLLTQLLEKQPDRTSTYQALAAIYADQKRNDQIEKIYQQGLQRKPDDALLMVSLAEHYQRRGEDQQALKLYEELQQKVPDSPVIKNNLALLLIEKFPNEENLRRAQSLTSGFNDSPTPAFVDTLGWLHYKMGNYPQAVSLLEDAVRKGGKTPEFYYHLGMAYLKSANPAKAKEQLELALAKPDEFPGRAEAEQALREL